MKCMQIIFVLAYLFLCSSCATTTPPVAFYETIPEKKLPPISFYAKTASPSLTEKCQGDRCVSDNRILQSVYNELSKSETFVKVDTPKDQENEYTVHAAFRTAHPGSEAGEFAGAMVSAATLLLIPSTRKEIYYAEFEVKWRGLKIAEYAFDIPVTAELSLYKSYESQLEKIAQSITSQFIAKLQGEDVFSSERIYITVKAEDYHRDLQPPLQIGEYRHRSFFLYPDPLLGVQLRYENLASQKEVADVFVYPIRQTDWSDSEKTTAAELDSALKDVELAAKAGIYKTASFGPRMLLPLQIDHKLQKGYVSSGNVTWPDGRSTTEFIYVFISKDKYLKFRFSVPVEIANGVAPRLNEFVTGFVRDVAVPDESYFMASLRQRKRNSTIQ